MRNQKKEVFEGPVIELTEEQVEEIPVEEIPVEESTIVNGVVTDCVHLRLRREPSGKVIALRDAGYEVLVDTLQSTDKWYKVYTKDDLDGFCMKEFITI